jgi:hypothetical protein
LLLESKAILNIRVLGSATEKIGYRLWNEKFINVMSGARPGSRNVLETLCLSVNEGMDLDEGIDQDDWEGILDKAGEVDCGLDLKRFQEELYSVLIEKTEGEAARILRSAGRGKVIIVYCRIHHRYTETTGLALSEMTSRIMMPDTAKREELVAEEVEKWEEMNRKVKELDDESALSDKQKMVAIRRIAAVGKFKEHFDMKNSELISKGYLGYRKEVMKLAAEKRLQKRKDDDDMDCANLGGGYGKGPQTGGYGQGGDAWPRMQSNTMWNMGFQGYGNGGGMNSFGYDQTWGGGQEYGNNGSEDMNALNKGKGKGFKGFDGKGKGFGSGGYGG